MLVKLRPDIKQNITLRSDIPKDREELIALAVRTANYLKLYPENQGRKREKKSESSRRYDDVSQSRKRERSRSPSVKRTRDPATKLNSSRDRRRRYYVTRPRKTRHRVF